MASRLITVHQEAETSGSPATPSRGRRGARTLRQSTATFGILASAFAISALYQAYRGTIMEIPDDACSSTQSSRTTRRCRQVSRSRRRSLTSSSSS